MSPSAQDGQSVHGTEFSGISTMRIAAVCLRPYRLPLVRPWVAATATIVVRSGTLVAVTMVRSETALIAASVSALCASRRGARARR